LAPGWLDMQFIAASVLLLVAAHWAYQSVGTLLESIRAGNYSEADNDDMTDLREPALPIDISDDRW
jgi:hypothetical protein